MSLRDILVCVDPTEGGMARLQLAVRLAREHGAHLSAAYVTSDAEAVAGDRDTIGLATPASGGATDRSMVWGFSFTDAERAAVPRPAVAEILEERFREATRDYAVGDWHLFGEDESADLVALIRAHDVAIVGQGSTGHRAPAGFRPNDLVMACGRPLLVLPYAGDFTDIGRRVLVAWDGTREAARGLHDALPLLTRAELAVVVTVRPDDAGLEMDSAGLGRIVRHLERHGVRARGEQTLQGDIPIADVLLSRAADLDVDLIVAGAFHHSQIREAVFGGVSRELLDHMTVPVLMSH